MNCSLWREGLEAPFDAVERRTEREKGQARKGTGNQRDQREKGQAISVISVEARKGTGNQRDQRECSREMVIDLVVCAVLGWWLAAEVVSRS